jgi:lysophospholipase L1-like esterase
VTRSYAKLQRSHTGVDNYQRASAGGRIRFVTTVPDVKFLFEFDPPQPSSYNGVFCVLVNGTEVDPINIASSTGQFAIEVVGTGSRTIELIWPHGGSYRFLGLQRFGSGTVTAATARPTKKLALYGDSITNGYFASRYTKTWAYLLGELQGAEVLNMGYGSEQSGIAGLGTEAGEIEADATLYCIGYNDFGGQVALASYKSNVQAFVDDFRAANPTGKLYLGGPFYTPNTNTLTPANYRTQIADIVTAEADANTILLDTLGAATNDATSWPDAIHPSNFGSAEIAVSFDAELDA